MAAGRGACVCPCCPSGSSGFRDEQFARGIILLTHAPGPGLRGSVTFLLDGLTVHRKRTKGCISKTSFSQRNLSLLIHLLFESRTGSISLRREAE